MAKSDILFKYIILPAKNSIAVLTIVLHPLISLVSQLSGNGSKLSSLVLDKFTFYDSSKTVIDGDDTYDASRFTNLFLWWTGLRWHQPALIPYHVILGYYYGYTTKQIYYFCKGCLFNKLYKERLRRYE